MEGRSFEMSNCSSCEQMKKENASIRKALMETNKQYVEVINENLELRRQLGNNIRYPLEQGNIKSSLDGNGQ